MHDMYDTPRFLSWVGLKTLRNTRNILYHVTWRMFRQLERETWNKTLKNNKTSPCLCLSILVLILFDILCMFYEACFVHTEICNLKPYKGACKDYVYKWYYNANEGKCHTFVYGGCLGNRNRFDTEAECMHRCVGGATREYDACMLTCLSLMSSFHHQLTLMWSTVWFHEFSEQFYFAWKLTLTLFLSPDTLPPYIRTQLKSVTSYEHRWVDGKWIKVGPTKPPVPLTERGEELTFSETGHSKTFMFARNNAFIQLDSNQIPTFQLRWVV
jgi:hypothetical protein